MAGAAIGGAFYDESYTSYGGGGGSTIYEGGDTIVVNGESEPVVEYAQEAQTLAENYAPLAEQVVTPTADTPKTPEVEAAIAESWMPMGIYAVIEENSTADPTRYVQMLISKSGAVAGELHDLSTNTSTPITGAVDPATKRVAWKIGGTANTTMETGLYNLTQSETPILVHEGTTGTKQLTMARIEEPPSVPTSTPPKAQ